ncbi:MAG: hypothetical protein ACTHZX_00550 [Microbacterium sp.]
MTANARTPRGDGRRRLRFWLLVGFAPIALVGLVIVAKILTMYAFAHQAVTAHVATDPAGTVAAAEGQEPLNLFERHLAPYNVGVGLATSDRLADSRAKFEEALPLASGLDACPVHINLALVVELMGDEAKTEDPESAAGLYEEALELNLDTPEECRSEEADAQSPDPERPNEMTLDDQQERLKQKQQEQEQQNDQQGQDDQQDEQDQQTEQEKQEQQDKLDDIEEKLQQGEQEREKNDDSGDENGGYGSDQPW